MYFVSSAIGTHARRRPDFYVDPISWHKEYGCPLTKREGEEVRITTFCIVSEPFVDMFSVYAGAEERWYDSSSSKEETS